MASRRMFLERLPAIAAMAAIPSLRSGRVRAAERGSRVVIVGGGYGVVGDIVIGVIGAFVGGYIFRALHIRVPFHGLAGTIFVAFIGAVALLLILRLIRAVIARGP